ncbi:MAG: P-II family nitrogen regulator, partial [Syntrophorhabdales bacterium]|nr:P-II family nitrogen regulator [Syntrophorhabdales bacterium]
GIIIKKARTGELGDGKIFTYPVEKAIRIGSGQQGEDAL